MVPVHSYFTPPEESLDTLLTEGHYLQESEATKSGDLTNVPIINELLRFRFLGQANRSYVKLFPVIVTVAIPNGGEYHG